MADLKKLEAAFELATKQYVVGKISFSDLQKALRKLEEAGRKAFGVNLDFREIDHYVEERARKFSDRVRLSTVDNMTKTVWKAIKKEAGIKSSGFLKKADANVSAHLEKYAKAHAAWRATVVKTAGGDHQMLLKAFASADGLQKALRAFVAAKEFRTDLARELQAKCESFIRDLEAEIADLAQLSKEAHDPSAALRAINNLGFAQFKI